MRVRLPIPSNWQDFETLCHQLWKEIWCDPNAQRNGRAGQPQAGVDVYGRPIYRTSYEGVQCKDKDSRLGSFLTEKQLLEECTKAKDFNPALRSFTLATTASSDESLQELARSYNEQRKFPFDVHVWSWSEIESEVACRPSLVTAFYQGAPAEAEDQTVKIAASAPRDQFQAFFARPQLTQTLGSSLKDSLAQVAYELCDNAFNHGKARHVRLSFDGEALHIQDDGKPFDPLSGLNASQASTRGHLGSYVLDAFQRKYRSFVSLEYARILEEAKYLNTLSVRLTGKVSNLQPTGVVDLPIDASAMFGRRGAQGLADAIVIPVGTKEVVINFSDIYNISGTFQFIQCLRDRLPESVLLTLSYPRDHLVIPPANNRDRK